jgi:drug/metabolite transporter (DMT)-like permease
MANRKLLHYAEYVALAMIWGFSLLFMFRVVTVFGLVGAVCFRALIAATILYVLALLRRRRLEFMVGWRPFAMVGATTVVGQLVGLSYATPLVGTAMTAIIVAAIPLFAILLGHYWGLERITPMRMLGLSLGIVGISLLVGFPSVALTPRFLLGCATALLGSFSAAFGSNYASKHLGTVNAYETTLGTFLAGGLISLPLLYLSPPVARPGWVDLGNLAVLGAAMSALAYVMYFRLISTLGASRAASVEFLVTLVAVTVGTTVLHERLSIVQLIGGVAILLGCALVLGLLPPLRAQPARDP